jgi:hypothetical protein
LTKADHIPLHVRPGDPRLLILHSCQRPAPKHTKQINPKTHRQKQSNQRFSTTKFYNDNTIPTTNPTTILQQQQQQQQQKQQRLARSQQEGEPGGCSLSAS